MKRYVLAPRPDHERNAQDYFVYDLALGHGLTLLRNDVRRHCYPDITDSPALIVSHNPDQLADARSKVDKLGDPHTDFFVKVVAVKTLDLARRGPTCPMEVQVFRLDADTAIVCLPCEIFVELGLGIKQASPFRNTIVISICNDRPSYVPTRKAFAEGSYEVVNSRVQSGGGEMLVEAALQLLRELKP